MILYCEKCKSEDIEEKLVTPFEEEERVSIEDYSGQPIMNDLVYRPVTTLIRCKVCGNSKEFTQ